MKHWSKTALIAVAALAASTVHSYAERTLRLSLQVPTNHPVGQNIVYFKDEVEKISGGEIKVELYDAAQLYKGSEVPQAVASGAIDMGLVLIDEYAATVPATGLFSVAFMFPDYESLAKAAGPDSPVRQKLDELGPKGFAEWLTVAGLSDGFEALAYLKNSNQGNYKDGDGNEAIGTADGSESGLGKFAFTGNDGGRFEAFASHLEDEGVRPSRPNYAVLANGAAPQWLSYRDTSVGVSYVDEMPSGQFDPEFSLAYSRTVLNIPALQGGANFYHVKSDIQSINGKAANNFEVDNGVITAGIDFYHDEATGYHNRSPRNGSYSETSTDIGAFSQARLSLTDQWRVSFGGRADQQWFEGLTGEDFSEFGLSGNANTEYDLTEQLMVYGGAGTSFGGLPLGESAIYEFSGNWNYNGFAPSRSYNAKVGSRLALDDWTLDGNLFYNLIDESHDLSSATRNSTVDLDTRGVNLSAMYSYGPGFARLTYSHTNVKTDGGVPLSTEASYQGVIMGDMFNFDAGHSFDSYGLRVGGNAEFALADDSPEERGNEKLDSYFVANLYAEWVPDVLNDAVTLRVDALNILDRDYIDRATTGYDSTRISEPFHEPGRTFLISAKVDF